MKRFCPWMKGVALFLVLFASSGDGNEIVGCGGFVKSKSKLDFNQIEIKLFSKGGSLKVKTECAPTTGYYFIPLEIKADYVLKISPPEGWTFEPSEIIIPFDGVTDPCSLGQDINFEFKGFSIFGSVLSSGFNEGPAGVSLTLSGPDGLSLTTMTGVKGGFQFDSISPGSYSLQASHPSFKFLSSKYAFTITNKNVQVDKEIVVSGYELMGRVGSDGNPVENVRLVLVSEDESVVTPKGCSGQGSDGLTLPSDVKGRILCVESSNSGGAFRFGGLSPGTYSVVPVYKGANIEYNVSPDRQQVVLGHGSATLPKPFEVQGFTVQGRVKGHSGANILVNGVHKATSGHDGTFSIPNVKPGSYEFEVTADKFLFDKKQIRIQPTNPVIPDFVPSKFQTCGSLNIVSKSSMPDLTLVFTKTSSTPPPTTNTAAPVETVREKVVDLNQACVYLSQGSWTVSIESRPEKYFLPQKSVIQVPSGSRFSFQEFSGSISGKVVTSAKSSSPDGVVVRAENKATGVVVQEQVVAADGKFSFLALESGDYRIKVDGAGFCWKSDTVEKVELKASNVENIVFIQTGVPLEMESSHSTQVSITGKTKEAAQIVQLEGGMVVRVCLTDPNSPPDSYRIVPQGCHTFEKDVYSFTPGTRLDLIAQSHKHSWSILAPSKISDLKVTRNGESTIAPGSSTVKIEEKVEEGSSSSVRYTISSQEESGRSVEWNVFSYGFIFEPSSFFIDALNDCQANLLQVVAKQSHVIKGKLTPALEGVEIQIELVGDPEATVVVTSDAKGEYIAGPFVHPSGFRVTPQLTGYIFKALDSDPHSFSVFQLAKIQVVVENKGLPVPGVLLSLSGPNSYRQNKMTDEGGKMTFGELGPGDFYLKALLKEFQFQPSAINIELKEQEAKVIKLQAIRESFSLYGQLSSLSGELLPHLLVSAKGMGNCSEYGEEGSSDEAGNFRIWALKSFCTYQVSVARTEEFANRVERTIPATLEVKIGTEDIGNISFVVITPVRRMDVSLRIHTNNEKSLEGLKAVVYAAGNLEVPMHSTPFNGISYLILPPIPKDDGTYIIIFESTLNKFQYTFSLPTDITFSANSAYAHFSTEFDIHPAPVDQEIGKNSYIALAMIILVVGLIANYERVGGMARELLETYASGSALAKKPKLKAK